MFMPTWLPLRGFFVKPRGRSSPDSSPDCRRVRPRLEELENRITPTALSPHVSPSSAAGDPQAHGPVSGAAALGIISFAHTLMQAGSTGTSTGMGTGTGTAIPTADVTLALLAALAAGNGHAAKLGDLPGGTAQVTTPVGGNGPANTPSKGTSQGGATVTNATYSTTTSITNLSVGETFGTYGGQTETVTGQIVFDGYPIMSGTVTVVDAGQTFTATPDSNGDFTATYNFTLYQELFTAPSHVVNVSFSGYTVNGTIYGATSTSINTPDETDSLLYQLLTDYYVLVELGY